MTHPLRCKCGTLRGHVSQPEQCTRLVCYCKDCQAFAHFLGTAGDVLDAMGGTDIVAVHPQAVTFTDGLQALACMSLSDAGMLRWYASCCNTPIGNTSRSIKVAYVGLVHSCLQDGFGGLDSAFGPVRMRSGATRGDGRPRTAALALVRAMARFASSLVLASLNGSYRRTPFFNAEQGTPVAAPKVLTPEQRAHVASLCT